MSASEVSNVDSPTQKCVMVSPLKAPFRFFLVDCMELGAYPFKTMLSFSTHALAAYLEAVEGQLVASQ